MSETTRLPRGLLLAAASGIMLMTAACVNPGPPAIPPSSPLPTPPGAVGSTARDTPDPPAKPETSSPGTGEPATRANGCSGPILSATTCLDASTAQPVPPGLISGTLEIGSSDKPPTWSGGADLNTIGPDGRLFGSRFPFSVDPAPEPPLEIGVYDNGILRPFETDSTTPARAVAAMATDGATVVWKETTATDLYTEDWWIKAFAGDAVTTVATSDDLGYGHVLPWAGNLIALVGETVYWTAAVPDPTAVSGGAGVLLARPLDGHGDPRVVAKDAYLPTSDGAGHLYFGAANAGVASIYRTTADGEPEMVVAQPSGSEYAMTGLAADARRVAWCVSQRVEPSPEATYHSWVYLQDLTSGSLTEVSLGSSPGGGNVLSLSGRWLAWGNGSGWGDSREFLFDLTSAKIFVVADTPGGSWIRVNDPAVAWYESPPPGAPYPILRVMTGFLREPS